MGTFAIQLLSGDKDCANFEGWLYSKDRTSSWRWTGHKAPKAPGCNWTGTYELHQHYEEKIGPDAGKIIEGPSFILQLTQGSPISDDAVHGKYNNVDIVGTAYNYGYMEAAISGITPWPEKYQSAPYGQIKLNFKNFPDDCNEVEGSWSAGTTMFNSFFATLSGRRILGETSGSGSTGASSTGARTAGEVSSIPGDSVPDPVPVLYLILYQKALEEDAMQIH